jgi:hypothetical protein
LNDGCPEFDFGRRKIIYLYFTVSSIQTGSGAHPASYSKDTGAFSLERKWEGMKPTTLLPSRAEVKNCGAIIHSSICLHGMVIN